MRGILVVLALALSGTPALSMDKYLCIGDQSTGFAWNGSAWAATKFRAQEEKYIVSELAPGDAIVKMKPGSKISVVKLGERFPAFLCSEPRDNILSCEGISGYMTINLETLRYLSHYPHGYVDTEDRPGDTPAITIGKCSKF